MITKYEDFELNEMYIGKAGKERVRKMLHKVVDQYVNFLDEHSDDAGFTTFYVKDMAKWYVDKENGEDYTKKK